MIYCRFVAVLLFACALFAQASQPVQLLSERYRTEWNWVEYRISLKNTSDLPVLNPHIRYFAENPWIQYCGTNPDTAECRTFDRLNPPADTMLEVFVDYSSYLYSVTSEVSSAGTVSVVELYIDGLLYPNHIVDINFRIYRKDWGLWNPSHDWSYQRNAEVVEPNYFMAVYDASGNILWGSDPLRGNVNADDILWSERGSNFNVGKFSGDTSEILPAGRFWMLKDSPVSPKERDLLAARGIVKHSGGVHQGKTLAFFRSENVVKKSTLDSIVAGFYNAFPVNDTTPVEIDLSAEDLYEERNVCDSNGVCHVELEPRTVFSVEVACWPDVSVDNCVETLHDCGGTDIGIARGFLVATVGKDSLQCLGRSRDVDWLNFPQKMLPTASDEDRDAVNISSLQNSNAWLEALASSRATEEWLSGVEYTGDGILVGVYDKGFDLNHPDFNEYDSFGNKAPRTMREDEFFGSDYSVIRDSMNMNVDEHGTAVAGIIGGNGNDSNGFVFRGVAPKVHCYFRKSYPLSIYANQIGHVVNHSHMIHDKGYYSTNDYVIDAAIFSNWTSECTKYNLGGTSDIVNCVEGDSLSKSVVVAASNNGLRPPSAEYGEQRGFHSVLSSSKNVITVGSMTSEEKVRSYNSSMGPTWDGRTKPDIMAPGATSQFVVDNLHPFQVQIDYVKIYRAGNTVPYFVLDFENNNLAVDGTNTSCVQDSTKQIINVDEKTVFNCIYNQPGLSGITIGWKLPSGNTVHPSDSMEVMLRRVQGGNRMNLLYGNVNFGSDSAKFDTSFRSLPVVWNFTDTFSVTRFGLRNLDSAAIVHFLRLDFSFVRGIIVPDLCRNDSCGYVYQAESGTSMAAPFVSGIAALMYQKFRETTGDPLDKHSMRNSTVKALMIHTAIDMVDSPEAHFAGNPDLDNAHHDGRTHFTPYGEGPDFATGWGRIDGKAALDMISQYNKKTKLFARFREIEIGNSMEKRWTVNVREGREKFRATLVWDDSPGNRDSVIKVFRQKEPKLINDLDMYLVSPSGKYYYPWRLDPLPTDMIDTNREEPKSTKGYENIHDGDVREAYNGCGSGDRLDSACFDHLNNVEVVDVNNPEPGTWQIVVVGKNVREFNNADSNAQVASLVSDLPLTTDSRCGVVHDYKPQADYSCTYSLGENSVSYVTFDERTFVGAGDTIRLFDENGAVLGTYTENRLAGRQLKLRSKRLTVELHSDNDNSQGWGFAVTKIKTYPYSAMKIPFDVITRKRRNP